MKIWYVRDGEPLPTDGSNRRLMRGGMLCAALAERGHSITWITSRFDHYERRHRDGVSVVQVSPAYKIVQLPALGYSRAISPARVVHNAAFAREFLAYAKRASDRPDIILTDIPTTEASSAVVKLGLSWKVPTLVSVRDLWPDFFVDFSPRPLRPLVKMLALALNRQTKFACRHASALVGISQGYLDWGLRKGARALGRWDTVLPLAYPQPNVEGADIAADRLLLENIKVDLERPVVSFIGSWGATYDLETILEAAALLEKRSDVQFVLAGDGDSRDSLLARAGMLSNVIMPGWLSKEQIGALLRHTAIGLMPYKASAPQGLPNKLFEYMAYGVFQISTLTGEAPEVLERHGAGVSIKAGSAKEFADAISEHILKGRDDAQGRRLREIFAQTYSADIIYSRFVDLIESVAAGSKTLPGMEHGRA